MEAADKLRFGDGRANGKLSKWKGLYTFSLPAGRACQFARKCRSRVVTRKDGSRRIQDGPHTEFRCFGASSEIRSRSLHNLVTRNYELVMNTQLDREAMVRLFDRSMPAGAQYIRVHATGGDMLSEEYLLAWMDVAALYPDVLFYGYTKALPYYIKFKDTFPDNLRMTPSRGGSHDFYIDQEGLHEAKVVLHPDEANELGLPIDHDDSHAMAGDHSFCLLIHGVQPAGGKAAAALKLLKEQNIKFGYAGRNTQDK
jgi:hypothetical protein